MVRVGWPLVLLFLAACPSRRMLRVENEALTSRNAALEQRIADLEATAPDPSDYARDVDLDVVAKFLDRAGWTYERIDTGSGHLALEYHGKNAEFGVSVRYFPNAHVVFLATSGYLTLEQATSPEAITLLLVQIAALDYDLLVGKFQLNPENGEVLLSMELRVNDGLGYGTFLGALHDLCATADDKKPDLERAIEGLGL